MNNQSLTSLWSLASNCDVFCISSSEKGDQIAIGTDTCCLALDAQAGRREFSSELLQRERVTAVAFVADGRLLVGGQGVLRLWDTRGATVLASLRLREDSQGDEERVFIAAQPEGTLFAVASESGRKILLVTCDLEVRKQLDLQANCGGLTELSWLSDSTLLATSNNCLQSWQYGGETGQACLVLGKSIGLVTATASPDKSTLAAGSRDGVVYLWSLTEGDQAAGEDLLSAELRSTLKDYRREVNILCWDRGGRFLASVDGAEATVWEVPKLFQETVQSTICCGHDYGTQVLCAAFQKDGPMLATGGSDGKVLFHNSDHFRPGALSHPCAAAQMIPSADGIVCLTWLPGGRLVAATKTGKVVGWELQPAAFEEVRTPVPTPSPALAAEEAVEEATATPAAPPPTPEHSTPAASAHQGSNSGRPESSARGMGPSSERGGVPPTTAGLEHGGRQHSRASRLPPSNLREQQALSAARHMSMPDTRERDASDKLRADLRANAARTADSGHLPPPPPQSLSERSKSLQDNSARRSGSLERQQPALSPSLMQHIQRVQQKPAANSRHREPAGWGMGSPSAPPTTQQQLAVQQIGAGMPFNPMAPPQPMAPGYMMYPGPNQAMMHPYGFPPGVTPVPMMTHPRTAQQGVAGMVDGGGMHPGGMVYMPMGPHAQQQWPVMNPWMGMVPYYHLPPGQPGLQEHVNINAAGRSTSAPDNLAPQGHNLASPLPSSGLAHSSQSVPREGLEKNSISLPHTTGREWRNHRVQAAKAEDPPQAVARTSSDISSTGGADRQPRRRASSSADLGTMSSRESGELPRRLSGSSRGDKLPKVEERKEHGSDDAASEGRPPPATHVPQTNGLPVTGAPLQQGQLLDYEGRPLDMSTPIVTVYVGNLAPAVDEGILAMAFAPFGPIANVQVIRDKNSMRSRGFAFVTYTEPACATGAMQHMNGMVLYGNFRGRTLKVGPSNRVISAPPYDTRALEAP